MEEEKNNIEYVWEFSNQKKLTKKEFIKYFEKKVFKTIRKYNMLPKEEPILIEDSNSIESNILSFILSKKIKKEIKKSDNPNLIAKSSTEVSEITFQNILNGEFNGPKPEDTPYNPFYFVSDKEIEKYSELCNIDGNVRQKNEKVQNLLEKFYKKNQDTDINILKALSQIKKESSQDPENQK